MDLVVTACWWTWQLYIFADVNTKVLTVQTVKRNRWRDHPCHYGQLSWYWDAEWVTCRWSMICASSWMQSWNDDTSNSLLESTTSDSVQRRRFVHPCQSWPAVYRLMRRAPFILHSCRYDSQSFLGLGVLPSSCGSSRIPTSNSCRCCVQDVKFCFWVDVQNYISMVVIWAFIEIHNIQGYLWSENVDALVGCTVWMVAAMSTTWTAALLDCCIDVAYWHTYTHNNSNVIPALSEF